MSEQMDADDAPDTLPTGNVYRQIAVTMMDKLGLRHAPVGVSLTADVRRFVPRTGERTTFCGMMARAARGESLYAEHDDHICAGALYYLGLEDLPDYPTRKTGVLERTIEATVHKRTSSPHLPAGTATLITCFPLEFAPVQPDVVVVICNPLQAMNLARCAMYDKGEIVYGLTAASGCSSVVAHPFHTGKVIFSLSDPGARRNMQMRSDELLVGIPAQQLEPIFNAILTVKLVS